MLSMEFRFGSQFTAAKTLDGRMGIVFPRFGNFQMRLNNQSIRDILHTPTPIKVFRFNSLLGDIRTKIAFSGRIGH
jgi:hypothetical protein